ncbi:MAG: hypothetical protein O7D35_03795, partial [Acidobacteria bacterium]|nr:hypothetical protein [Acidobacteriota bacterium]
MDGTFSTSGTDSGTSHDWTNLGVAISALTVDGVTVQVEHRHSKDSNTGTYTCQLIDDVGNLCGSPKTSVNHGHKAEAVETLGGPADTWGCALTESVVESANFGISCYYTMTAGRGGGNRLRVDEWHVNVHFSATGGCAVDPDCDDGLFCNGAETCLATVCQPGTPPVVEDGIGCTDDICDEAGEVVVITANDA